MKGLAFGLLAMALARSAFASGSTDETTRLLEGVRAFRADRLQEALAAFQEVERGGGGADLAIYLGPTLYKLGRFREARAVLAPRRIRGVRDGVADYYLALTYVRLGLSRLAEATFAAIDPTEAGPRLAGGATRFVASLRAASPPPGNLPSLFAEAEKVGADAGEAFDYAVEAFLRSPGRSPDRRRAALLVARLGAAIGAASAAHDILSGELDRPVEAELARAAASASERSRPQAPAAAPDATVRIDAVSPRR